MKCPSNSFKENMRLCDCGNPSAYQTTGQGRQCRECRTRRTIKWRQNNSDKHKNTILKRKFGLSLEDYKRMEKAQNGLCAICKQPNADGRALAVDHNHNCCGETKACDKCRRGLLCGNCNRGLGNLQDNPAVLYRAIEYLNQYQK